MELRVGGLKKAIGFNMMKARHHFFVVMCLEDAEKEETSNVLVTVFDSAHVDTINQYHSYNWGRSALDAKSFFSFEAELKEG